MLWKRKRVDSHLFGPTAQHERGARYGWPSNGPYEGAPARGSFAEMDPHYYIIGLHCLALFLETQLLHEGLWNILSLQWGSPRRARARRSGSSRHGPVTPAL